MRRRQRVSGRKTEEGLQRFLRPGALAQLRDSKICARSPRSAMKALQIAGVRLALSGSQPSAAVSVPPDGMEGEVIRFFASRPCAPRTLQRKKLSAAKYVFFSPPSPDPADPMLDVIGADFVAAH